MVEKTKILILGAGGMLGHELMAVFSHDNPIGLTSADLDITDLKQAQKKLQELKPDIVVNAAAYTAVDDCEQNRDLAMKVNGEGPGNVAKICTSLDAILVHFSTDYVFNGQKADGYAEDYDKMDPLSVYGESKALGEKLIQKNCQKYYILRTAWLYGKNGINFVDTMIKLGQEKKELKVVNDQHGSPTYAKDLAIRTKEILFNFKPTFGIYHTTNAGDCTWYEFANEIFKIKNIQTKVMPCTSDEFPRPARRPDYSILLNTKLPAMRPWQDAVREYLIQQV